MGVVRLPLKVVIDDTGFNIWIEDANGQRVSLNDLRYVGVFNLRLADFVVLACNHHDALMTALKECHKSLRKAVSGFGVVKYEEIDKIVRALFAEMRNKDRALLRKAKGE